MPTQQWEIADWNDQESDGMVHVRQAALVEYETDEQGTIDPDSRRVLDSHNFKTAHKIPKQGAGRGQAISDLKQALASLRTQRQSEGQGKPEVIEGIEAEING